MELKQYFNTTLESLKEIKDNDRECILEISEFLGKTIPTTSLIHLVGLNQGITFSMELNFRAGGLMSFSMFDPKSLVLSEIMTKEEFRVSDVENDVSLATKLWDLNNVHSEDVFIFSSFDGTEPLLIELAEMAKRKNHKIISVTNTKTCKAAKAKHSSGKKLLDFGDYVIDYNLPEVDAITDVDGIHKMNQLATVRGDVIAQMITAETYKYLKDHGQATPILLSANINGADVHNAALSDKFKGRGRY